jgi:uncharacterized membrane protein YgdD (TMEM256/DUF423 family)
VSRRISAARALLALGGLSAFLAVALGAMAAHGLKASLAPEALATFEIGVRYQMYHALAMIAAGLVHAIRPLKAIAVSGGLFALGTVLFSGSLYLIVLCGVRALGIVTPFGGVAFLAGWLCFVWGVWRA